MMMLINRNATGATMSPLLVVILILLSSTVAEAGWSQPVEVISGAWGSVPGEFGYESEDTGNAFPSIFGTDKEGNVVISDEVNNRIQIFSANGNLLKIIDKPNEINVSLWPASLIVYPEGNSLLGNLYIFNYVGEILYKINIPKTERYGFSGGYVIRNLETNSYLIYSPTGQLIRTSTMKPLELGQWTSLSLTSGGGYKHVIIYHDKKYSFVLPYKTLTNYWRDKADNIIVVGLSDPTPIVYKLDHCGKILGQLQMLESKGHVVGSLGKELVKELDYEYGLPVIAPNGDVYTWKRTPDKYSILKWTWQDDPNVPAGPDAPTKLTLMPSITGIYLTWTASPSDPGCVTGYEVARATTSGGVFSSIGTVNAGMAKYNDTTATAGTTYYYKVRTVAGNEYSPYTAEVSGKR